MRITIVDYLSGNLHSLIKALEAAGATVRIETDADAALETDALVLPGVGAFGLAAARLAPHRAAIRDALGSGLPCLGIGLGMQLLFDESEEGAGAGLGVISGRVERLRARHVPHIGWNAIDDTRDPLLRDAGIGIAYFANSYVCRPTDMDVVIGWSTHEATRFPAAVRVGATIGVQFQPEKSSVAGVRFLREFVQGAAHQAAHRTAAR
jgi:glutamine amidotransferase